MATKYWLAARDGDFDDVADWLGGGPGTSDNAVINAAGSYTVTLDDSHTLQNLTVSGPGAQFVETAAGALHAGSLSVWTGASATLAGANQITTLDFEGGTVRVDNPAALSGATIYFDAGSLIAATNLTLAGLNLDASAAWSNVPDVLAATPGKTLTLIDSVGTQISGCALQFGQKGDTGTILFDPSNWLINFDIAIDYGTVKLGDAGAEVFANQWSSVAKGATLDLNGFNSTANLSFALNDKGRVADGTITNSNGLATLDYHGAFDGKLTGGLNVEFADQAAFGGAMTIAGDAVLDGALTLTSSGSIDTAIALTGTTNGPAAVLTYGGARSLVLSGDLSGAGELVQQGRGTLTLTHANSFTGGAELDRGTTVIGNGSALGASEIFIDGGTLLADADITLSNTLRPTPVATVAAVNGATLTLSGYYDNFTIFSTVTFGAAGDAGTVVDAFAGFSGQAGAIVVADGTLQFSDVAGSDALTADAQSTTVRSGARLDLAGNAVTVTDLFGSGSVISSGASAAHLTLNGGNFDGVISGLVAVEVGVGDSGNGPAGAATLTGADTYIGGTTIDAGAALLLGNGGKTGSVAGAIVDNGLLILDHANNITLSNAISGTGGLEQDGTGTVTLTGADSYSGNTTVTAGTLVVGTGAELGTSYVTLDGGVLSSSGATPLGNGFIFLTGGELLERTTAQVHDSLTIGQGGGTIAAAHGTTLTLTGYFEDDYGPSVTFGDAAGHDGTIVFAPGTADPETAEIFHVAAGVLQLGDAGAAALFTDSLGYVVDAGATLDLNGWSTQTYGPGALSGAGTITNSSATAATLIVYQNPHDAIVSSTFAGTVSGKLTLEVQDNLTLAGAGSFTNLQIDAGAAVTLGGAATEKITFAATTGELALTGASHLTGVIYQFGDGDEIDLQGVAFAAATYTFNATSHLLTIRDGGHSLGLKMNGHDSLADFVFQDDGTGHVLVTAPGAAPGGHAPADFVV